MRAIRLLAAGLFAAASVWCSVLMLLALSEALDGGPFSERVLVLLAAACALDWHARRLLEKK